MPALRSSARYRSAMPTSGEPGSAVLDEPELAPRLLHLARPEQQQAEVEADGGGLRELARERPEPGERLGRAGLVEEPDGRRHARLRVVRRGLRGRRVTRARPTAAFRAVAARRRRRGGRRPCPSARGARAAPPAPARPACGCRVGTSVDGTKIGRLRAKSGWRRLPAVTAYAVSGSRDAADFQASSAPASPAQNRAMPRLSCTAALFGCSPESCVRPGNGAVRPGAERLADPRLEGVVPGEELLGFGALAGVVEAQMPRAGRRPRGRRGRRGRARAAVPRCGPSARRPQRRRACRSSPR